MNHNEEVPDFLGGLGDMLPADVLKKVSELLEHLHWKDKDHLGSHLQIVYVASGAQHVETQINMGEKTLHKSETLPSPPCVGREKAMGDLPEVLCTEAAMALWKKAQAAGWIDANYQPLISRTQAALLADAMAERLGIREKWKVFEAWLLPERYRSTFRMN